MRAVLMQQPKVSAFVLKEDQLLPKTLTNNGKSVTSSVIAIGCQ